MTFVWGMAIVSISAWLDWMRLRRGFGQTAGPSAAPQDDICSGEWRLFEFQHGWAGCACGAALGKPQVPSLRSGQALRLRLRMTFVWGMTIVWVSASLNWMRLRRGFG
jgi:hypothetical protein